ncbi:ankyrin repeat-containing domain protein [Trichoderma compactum]
MTETPAGTANEPTIYKIPEELFGSLDASFDEILLKIDKNLQSRVINSLKWLAFSFERLTIDLFTESFALHTDKSALFERSRKAQFVQYFVENEVMAAALDGTDVRKWALNAAAAESHFDIIKLLFRNGIEIDQYTLGKVAGSSKDEASVLECLHFLLDNSPSITKEEALCKAAFGGYWAAFELLLALDIDQSRIEYLLGLGADPNVQGRDHGTALQAVCYSYSGRDEDGCMKVAKLLIALGVDIAAQGGENGNALNNASKSKLLGTAFQAACAAGNMKLVRLLLDRGADVNLQGGGYGSALQSACHWGHTEAVRFLLDNGVDVNAPVRKIGGRTGTALLTACSFWRNDDEMVHLLLDHDARIQIPGVSSGSVLHGVALSNKSKDNSLLLRVLESGADINQVDESGGTALHYALGNMRFDSKDTKLSRIRFLIERGADVHLAVGELGSPLYSICAATTNLSDVYEKDRTVALLLEICPDIDVNAQGGEYGSALAGSGVSGTGPDNSVGMAKA